MWNGAYYIIVVIVGVWCIFSGYRKGLMRQMGVVLAVAFGIACSRLFGPEFMPHVDEWLPASLRGFNRDFVCQTLTYGSIYLLAECLVALFTMPVGKLLRFLGSGILDSLSGAVFRLFQGLMVLSIVYNLLVDLNPDSELTRSSRLHDGNLVEAVMKVAPAILGFPDAEEVAYRQQLEDAKKIS